MFTNIKLEVPVDQDYLDILHCNINESSRLLGLEKKAVSLLNLAVEEIFSSLCRNRRIEGREGSDEKIFFNIYKTANLLNIEINYLGLPLNLSFEDEYDAGKLSSSYTAAGLETFLIKHSVDFFTYKNLGPRGLQFILQKQLYNQSIADSAEADRKPAVIQDDECIADYREPLNDEEVFGIVQLIYFTYGSTYGHEDFYYLERVKNMLKEEKVFSLIAVTNKNKIAGHCALIRHTPDSPVLEIAVGATNPNCRGKGILKELTARLLDLAKERGFSGVFAEAVTTHPYSQKAFSAFNMKETALLLGYEPDTVSFKAISEHLTQRMSFLVAFVILKEESSHLNLHVCQEYHKIIRAIYNNLGAEVSFCSDSNNDVTPTIITSVIDSNVNKATITIEEAGYDFRESVKTELKRVLLQKVDVIYLNINMDKNFSEDYYNYLFRNGFFFAGIFPWRPFANTLVLQKMNNYDINFDKVILITPMAEVIKKFMKNDQERIEQLWN